ncbi:glycoside hydrolase [Clostridium sp. MCC353]|nr:glycoside hydrolase [Clostridium sp. MCC353]
MDRQFEKRLEESMWIHVPLTVDESKSIEHRNSRKKILNDVRVWDEQSMEPWTFDGEGHAEISPEGTLVLTTGSRADHWPENEVRAVDAANGYYATFGSYIAKLNVKDMDMSRGNRIWFQVKPMCPGLHNPIIRAGFVNNGIEKIPDAYSREGFNAINLKNYQWNICIWEIDSIAHDKIEELSFNVHRYGQELSGGEELRFELRDIRFQEAEYVNVVHGWQCREETAVFSTAGYFKEGVKTAVANTKQTEFEVVDADSGQSVYRGPIERRIARYGEFGVMDFTEVKEDGVYFLRFGDYESEEFPISDTAMDEVVWKLVNFLFGERCGYPVPQKHGTCHGDVYAEHNGLKLAYQGGWHDAADVSQQTIQTAEVTHSILETAQAVKGRNPMLYRRLMEEANWGLDFVLRMRFGDGYRATGATIRRWTDGMLGNMDDCEARVHNRSFDNFVMSGLEAYAGMAFAKEDQALAWKCKDAARQDYGFALERFRLVGMEEPYLKEHTASASLSQYYAAAGWAAAQIYQATRDPEYIPLIAEFINKMAACQETDNEKLSIHGFFYRDESKKAIVHFSHQSRDQIFVQALCEALKALPDHPDREKWEAAARLYGDYLLALTEYTAPYGMVPAGIFSETEADDVETFQLIHPKVDYDRERINYIEQLKQGVPLGNGYYLKCFPVWFSYRGNSALHLSMGKAASLLGAYFKDERLTQVAREQLYWTVGKNPFGQSIIYGAGSSYGQQYTALLGETVGEIPVGIQTRANEDLPYWPQANIATYREVWTTPVGRWLWIAADLL